MVEAKRIAQMSACSSSGLNEMEGGGGKGWRGGDKGRVKKKKR